MNFNQYTPQQPLSNTPGYPPPQGQFQPQQYYPNNTNYAQPPPHVQYPNDGKNWYQPSANYSQQPNTSTAPQYGYCEMGGEHDIRYHTKGQQWALLLICPIVCFSGRNVVCKKCKKKLGEIP
jgi:hypothetical protein